MKFKAKTSKLQLFETVAQQLCYRLARRYSPDFQYRQNVASESFLTPTLLTCRWLITECASGIIWLDLWCLNGFLPRGCCTEQPLSQPRDNDPPPVARDILQHFSHSDHSKPPNLSHEVLITITVCGLANQKRLDVPIRQQ